MKRICTLSLFLFFFFHEELSAQVQALSVVDTFSGCKPKNIIFQDASTGATSVWWDFDDGSGPTSGTVGGSVARNFLNSGVYNVVHWASNGGVSDTEYILIRIFQGPEARFEADETTGCAPLCVYFANQTIVGESAIDPGNIVWDYGDPIPTTGYNGYHCYAQGGSYQVSLFVKDFNKCESKLVKPNYINVRTRPRVSLSANPAQACTAPQLVTLTATITTPTQGPYTFRFFPLGIGLSSTCVVPTPVTTANCANLYANGIYDACVEVTDGQGCKDTGCFRVQITDLVADFSFAPVPACQGTTIQFTDLSNFSSLWNWNFGDPGSGANNTSTLKNPTHTFANPGTYTVTLPIRFNACRDTISKVVNILPAGSFTISANQTYQCTAPFTVNFTATPTSGVITSYTWFFGDGDSAIGQNVSHQYQSEGNFTVTVKGTNSNGCISMVTMPNYIKVKDIVASFTVDRDSGCSPLRVRFTGTGTSSQPGAMSYRWIWGDGTITDTTSPNALHTYTKDSSYKPILIVTNGAGCPDTFVFPRIIKVGSPKLPTFYAEPDTQCVNKPVIFWNTTDTSGMNPPPTFQWHFGDMQGSVHGFKDSTSHIYSDPKTYTITLTIFSQGCRRDSVLVDYVTIVDPKAEFEFRPNCANSLQDTFISTSIGADSLNWNFGNGYIGWSTDSIYVHTFPKDTTYKVTLWVKNVATGCDDSISKTVTVSQSSGGFRADTLQGCFPLAVRFTDTSSSASAWRWNFGDTLCQGAGCNTSSQRNPTHTYNRPGLYTVTLVINPGTVCPDTVRKVAYITVYGTIPWFETIPPAGCVPLNVNFRDSSIAFMGTVNSWSWNFGDTGTNNTSTLQNPSHRYDSSGTKTITLTVGDTRGCTTTVSRTVQVIKTIANFTVDSSACPGDGMQFTNLSTDATHYFWDFGDGGLSQDTNPTHIFNGSGNYTVKLVAINNDYNCSDTLRRIINISLPSVDFFDTSGFAPCPPFPVRFFNTSVLRPGYSFEWNFGDGSLPETTIWEPIHVFFFPGDYDITLTLTDTNGTCKVSKTYYDLIRIRGPIGRFRASTDSGCTPLTVCVSGTLQSTFSIDADMGRGEVISYTNLYGQTTAPNLCYTYDSAGTYYPVYILKDSLNCTVAYPVDTIIVGSIPYPNLPIDTTVCEGNYVQFNLTDGDNFQWRSKPTPAYLSCMDCGNPISSSPDTITYYVTATTNIGCFARDTITLNVDPLPDVFPGLVYRICPGDTLQLSAGNGVATATWSPPLYIDDTSAVNPKVWPPDTQTYRVTAFNKSGCSISKIVQVVPIQSVTGTVSPRDTVICEGAAVQFEAQVLDASVKDTSILWTPSQYLNAVNIYNPVLHAPAGDYTYYVTITSSTCSAYEDSVHVLVSPFPNLEAGDNVTVTEGTTVNLWASSSGNVVYTWTPTVDTLSCTDCRTPFFNPIVSQAVYVSVTNEYGCTTGDSVYIQVVPCNESIVFVPNTFTPNGDNRNDILYVRGGGLRQLDFFRIYDRWGRLVWETDDIGEGWDGTVQGQISNTATFVYMLQAECSSGLKVEKQGDVTLVR